MQTSLLAIAKAQEGKDNRFFNLDRLIDESHLLNCWRDIRKKRGVWRGSNQCATVRREPDRQRLGPRGAAEEEEVSGQTRATALDSKAGWPNASAGDSGGRR